MSEIEKAMNKILAGLVEANEFVIGHGDYASGVALHQFNADGTVTKITADQFWESTSELLQDRPNPLTHGERE